MGWHRILRRSATRSDAGGARLADGESFMALVLWPAALGKGIERVATGRGTG